MEASTPHAVNTAWAMLALIYAGQVCSFFLGRHTNVLVYMRQFSKVCVIILGQSHYLIFGVLARLSAIQYHYIMPQEN